MGMRYEDFWYNYTLREFWNAVEGFFESEKHKDIRAAIITASIENKPVNGFKIPYKSADDRYPWLFDKSTEADQETVDRLKKHMEEENKKILNGK